VLATRLVDAKDSVLQRNFTTFIVEGDAPTTADARRRPHGANRSRAGHRGARRALDAQTNGRCWAIVKLNGAGSGFFEYAIPWPAGLA